MKLFLILTIFGYVQCETLRQKAKQIYVGTGVDTGEIQDPQVVAMAGKQFNMLTTGNEMKWDANEPVQNRKTYERADFIVNYAQKNNMRMRGHCLVWHAQLPQWVNSLNATALKSAMTSRITDILRHYKGKIYSWDVVNEVLADQPGKVLRDSIWSRYFGENFIADAFRIAHQVDPNTKLYINDYGIAAIGDKSNKLYNLVKKLKSQGVPIHGVGFQTHLALGSDISSMKANLQRFVNLGLEVAVTELDVKMRLPSNNNTLQQQAREYASVFSSCISVKGCVGVTLWGFSDKHSWIPHVSPGWGDALIFDKNFQPKPAFYAIEKVLR